MARELLEDEYSYPPEPEPVDLAEHGVQTLPPSKRGAPTTRLYAKPLDEAAFARIRARAKRENSKPEPHA